MFLFPKEFSNHHSALAKLVWFIGGNPVVLLPLVTLAVMFTLWWYKGRDPDPGESVAPMYEPPAGSRPPRRARCLTTRFILATSLRQS